MADFGDFLSGAGSGAAAGSTLGPWGAAIGGAVGGIAGLFSPKNPPLQTVSNPYQGQIDAATNKLLDSHTGAQMAQNAAAGYRRDARASFDAMGSNAGISGNAAVMAALYGKTQRTADDAITNANVQGSEIDQRNRQAGLNAAESSAKSRFSMDQYNNYVNQANNRPGFFQNILMNSIGTLAGKGIAKLGGGDSGSGGSGYDPSKPAGQGGGTLGTPIGPDPTINTTQGSYGGPQSGGDDWSIPAGGR